MANSQTSKNDVNFSKAESGPDYNIRFQNGEEFLLMNEFQKIIVFFKMTNM